jgi:hypothetical protein
MLKSIAHRRKLRDDFMACLLTRILNNFWVISLNLLSSPLISSSVLIICLTKLASVSGLVLLNLYPQTQPPPSTLSVTHTKTNFLAGLKSVFQRLRIKNYVDVVSVKVLSD